MAWLPRCQGGPARMMPVFTATAAAIMLPLPCVGCVDQLPVVMAYPMNLDTWNFVCFGT